MTTEVTETLEKIRQYTQKTNMGSITKKYAMTLLELFSLLNMEDSGMAVITAFDYGRAKGYRAAMSERKRKISKGGSKNA